MTSIDISKKFVVKQPNQRLDKFISKCLSGISRSRIKKLIKQNKILVNGREASPHYNLKMNDIVNIINLEITKTSSKYSLEEKVLSPVKIIEETPDCLVINKPAGLITHGSEYIKGKTLTDWLIKKCPAIKKVGDDPSRPGLVHRLDKEASGLMVIAKTQKSFKSLKEQFKNRKVIKKYIALVYGQVKADSGIINFPIIRSKINGKMIAKPFIKKGIINPEGKSALTEFQVIKRYINFTLLKVKIKTGRTHQIRVHFSAFSHPLVGDNLYSTARTRIQNKKINLGRIFLVATQLTFNDPEGTKRTYKTNLPKQLKEFLTKIK